MILLTDKQRQVLAELPEDGSWAFASQGSQWLGAARTQLVNRGLVERYCYGSHSCRITDKGREALRIANIIEAALQGT